MPLQLFFHWFFGLAADFIWPEQKCCTMWHRVMTNTISKFQTTGSGACVFCAFPYVYMTINQSIWNSTFIFRLYRRCFFGCRYWCGAVLWEEARNSVQRGTATFSWHLLAIEQCHEKKDQNISLGNYFSRGNFCIKVLLKMTGLLKYLYQSSLIKIDLSVSLLVKRALYYTDRGISLIKNVYFYEF